MEGTETHKLGAELIDLARRNIWHSSALHVPGDYNPDQKTAAWQYAQNVRGVMMHYRIFTDPNFLGVERSVALDRIYPGMYGTPDAFIYSREHGQLIVWDLKYGFYPVDSFENWQLVAYTFGIVSALHVPLETTVYMRIIQPRAWKKRHHWKITVAELAPYFQRLVDSAHAVFGPEPTATPGNWCKFCRAKGACEALDIGSKFICDYVKSPMPQRRTPQDLAIELAILDEGLEQAQMRRASIAEQVSGLNARGQAVPGYSANASSKLDWSVPIQQVKKLAQGYGVDVNKPDEVITPLQAIKAGVPESVVGLCSARIPGKINVKRTGNSFARKVFGGNI